MTVDDIDVMFLLDSTDRSSSTYFSEQQTLVISLIDDIMLTKHRARFGLYNFGDDIYNEFQLNSYDSAKTMAQQVRYMWYSTGHVELSAAINATVSRGFTVDAGDRECVPNMLIISTYTPINDTSTANALKRMVDKKHITVIVLNLAGPSAEENLITFAGNASRVINVADPESLSLEVQTVLELLETGRIYVNTSYSPTYCVLSCKLCFVCKSVCEHDDN